MKRLSLFPALLVLAFSVAEAPAFDPFYVPDIQPGNIVGSWALRFGAMRHTITFAKDGSFRGTLQAGERLADAYEGLWRIETPYIGNPVLHYTYTKSKLIPPGTKDADVIEVLNEKTFQVLTRNGRNQARRIWSRAPGNG